MGKQLEKETITAHDKDNEDDGDVKNIDIEISSSSSTATTAVMATHDEGGTQAQSSNKNPFDDEA